MDRGNRLIYGLMKRVRSLAMALPRPVALACGIGFADALYRVYRLTPYRDFVFGNIQKAYRGELSDREAHRLAHAHLRNLLRAIVELMRFGVLRRDGLEHLVSWQGKEHLDRVMAAGRGVIVASAHLGNWELMGAALVDAGLPMHVLVQVPSQDAFGQLFIEARDAVGVRTYANRGPSSLRPVLRALKNGEGLGVLVDQHGEAQDALATLFGRPVSVPMGAFFFAQKTGAAILPMFCIRQPGDRHMIHVLPEIAPSGDPQEDARRLYEVLERTIRTYPEQWLWVHNRWEKEAELRQAPREVLA